MGSHGVKVSLAGQFYERVTDQVESPLTVTAVAFDNGEDSVEDCFKPTMEEYLAQGAKVANLHPPIIAQNSLHGAFGCSGDIAKVPPKGVIMGPRDAMKAKFVLDTHGITTAGTHVAWQRLTSRLVLFGKPSQEVPESILQLRENPTHVVLSENIASTIVEDDFFQY